MRNLLETPLSPYPKLTICAFGGHVKRTKNTPTQLPRETVFIRYYDCCCAELIAYIIIVRIGLFRSQCTIFDPVAVAFIHGRTLLSVIENGRTPRVVKLWFPRRCYRIAYFRESVQRTIRPNYTVCGK